MNLWLDIRRPCLALSTTVATFNPASRASWTVRFADVAEPVDGMQVSHGPSRPNVRSGDAGNLPPQIASQSPRLARSSSAIPLRDSARTSWGIDSGSTSLTIFKRSGPSNTSLKSTPMHIPNASEAATKATPSVEPSSYESWGGNRTALKSKVTTNSWYAAFRGSR